MWLIVIVLGALAGGVMLALKARSDEAARLTRARSDADREAWESERQAREAAAMKAALFGGVTAPAPSPAARPRRKNPSRRQRVTLAAGGEQQVVGEASYQDALERAAGGRTEFGGKRQRVIATLVLEPTNPHDSNAVRVEVGGEAVGYLPRGAIPAFRPLLLDLEARGVAATCRAELTGGWDRGGGDRGHFGIVLDVTVPPEEAD